jgi:hypothetical protein
LQLSQLTPAQLPVHESHNPVPLGPEQVPALQVPFTQVTVLAQIEPRCVASHVEQRPLAVVP